MRCPDNQTSLKIVNVQLCKLQKEGRLSAEMVHNCTFFTHLMIRSNVTIIKWLGRLLRSDHHDILSTDHKTK